MTKDDFRFYSNPRGDYHLKVDDAGRAFVHFDDRAGGVHFELAAFLNETNIVPAREALVILIADLIQEAQANVVAKAA